MTTPDRVSSILPKSGEDIKNVKKYGGSYKNRPFLSTETYVHNIVHASHLDSCRCTHQPAACFHVHIVDPHNRVLVQDFVTSCYRSVEVSVCCWCKYLLFQSLKIRRSRVRLQSKENRATSGGVMLEGRVLHKQQSLGQLFRTKGCSSEHHQSGQPGFAPQRSSKSSQSTAK